MAEAGNRVLGGPVLLPGGRPARGADRQVPIGRHGLPREEIRAVQRAKILDAFVAEVGDKGFAGTKVIDVCGRAAVSAKEFYTVFGSKDDCFFTAFDLGAELVWAQGSAAFEQAEGLWEDRVRAAIQAMLETLAANPAFCRLCIVEARYAGPDGMERLQAVIQRCRRLLGGDRQVEVPPGMPVDACESALVGGALRPLVDYVRAGRAGELAELVPLLTYSIALPVVGQQRALRQLEAAGG
ncbi:MAG TPA: TetR/AcrR family transcriptional regulator [Acidimicrobiales bacterium]|jgi:AcrR family transcriptional regulator|nr:TetR/AcrR family transcriptional regulator [Acidimicrobiales bacterium]